MPRNTSHGLYWLEDFLPRQLIDGFFKIGFSVSYDCVLELTKNLYQNLHEAYSKHGCFFPRILKQKLFSVWLKDNIDVNPKANFAKSSYHGTSSSMIQFVTNEEKGEDFPHGAFDLIHLIIQLLKICTTQEINPRRYGHQKHQISKILTISRHSILL